MTIEGPSRIIKDKEEAQAVADAGKPFRDQATEAKGRVGADREVLERVADDVENEAGKEYRELKELLPTEVIDKLSKNLSRKCSSGSQTCKASRTHMKSSGQFC